MAWMPPSLYTVVAVRSDAVKYCYWICAIRADSFFVMVVFSKCYCYVCGL